MLSQIALLIGVLLPLIDGHAQMTIPQSNRIPGVDPNGTWPGDCSPDAGARCVWYTSPTFIKTAPTLPDYARSYNLGINSGPNDWSATYPWRSPGSAPVFGSGCGIAGGNKVTLYNGGASPPGVPQGFDGADLAVSPLKVIWTRGENVEVGFALTGNE